MEVHYHPVWVLLIYHLPTEFAVRAFEEVPRSAVRLQRADIEGVETFDVEIPPGHEVVVKDGLAIDLDESSGWS